MGCGCGKKTKTTVVAPKTGESTPKTTPKKTEK
jgi:hypothetical protein